MDKTVYSFLLLAFLSASPSAQAEVTVTKNVVQHGAFKSDEHLCYADIEYPQINGMKDEKAQKALNEKIKKMDDSLLCNGSHTKEKINGEDDEDSTFFGRTYEVTFQSQDILGLQLTVSVHDLHYFNWTYGLIIDLKTGRILTIEDVFGKESVSTVNQYVQDALIHLPDNPAWDMESVRNAVKKTTFFQDNECDGCTLIIGKTGVNMVFESMDWGFSPLPIPAKYITYPALQPIVRQ